MDMETPCSRRNSTIDRSAATTTFPDAGAREPPATSVAVLRDAASIAPLIRAIEVHRGSAIRT